MPLPSTVRERCRALLPPGEELRYVFPATTVAIGRGALGTMHVVVAVTDGGVTVLSCSWFGKTKPDAIWGRYPRDTQLGPVDTSRAPTLTLGDLVLEIDEEYVPVVRAADAEMTRRDYLPPDPLPDL